MNSYESVTSPKGPAKWLLWSLVCIFVTTLTTFMILEVRSLNAEQPSMIRIILNTLNYTNEEAPLPGEGQQVSRVVLVNVEDIDQTQDELVKTVVTNVEEENVTELVRKAREAGTRNVTEVNHKNNSYYEEQTPVVVYSKTDQEAPLAYRQESLIPHQQGSHEEPPYYNGESDADGGNADGDYANDEESYYRPQYDDDSREDFEGPQSYNAGQDSAEGRSSQNRQFESYYRQWHYATPPPSPLSASSSASTSASKPSASSSSAYTLAASSKGNRKLPDMTAPAIGAPRDPYASYMDDYDYMPDHRSPAVPHQYQQQQVQAYRPQSSSQAAQKQDNEGSEMNILSILKTLKTMWDLYQSFVSAWNSMAEHRNKQEELAKQKHKQQQRLRINSKKPPKIISKTKPDGPGRTTKNPKQTTTTTPAPTSTSPLSTEASTSSSAEDGKIQQLQKDKVEPRKGSKGDKLPRKDVKGGLREKREAGDIKDVSPSTDVGEGRYIKGDPLKGYYDFVITEGSYKFWAAFQVGTALLIIYSTFAAIYYSKVNPLVSDYDYTDYLGGGRSLSGGDLDFVDDEMTTDGVSASGQHKGALLSKGWFEWMPRSGHSLKFILDAIDKLPVDHGATTGDAHDDARENLNEITQKKAM